MTDIRVAAEQAREALQEAVYYIENPAFSPSMAREALRALASLEAALAAQPEQQQGLVAASPAAAAQQPLNVQPWPPGSSMLQVAVAPHAAAGPYPTAMRPATAEEAATIASRFGALSLVRPAAAAGVPTGFKLVPIEATQDMIRAGQNSEGRSTQKNMESHALIWRDMLASSPVAPVGAPTRQHSVHLAAAPIDQDFRDGQELPTAAPQGWQPIETAPRDGTPVFAFWMPKGVSSVSEHNYGLTLFERGEWWDTENDEHSYADPTHWMPLPLPPKEQK